MRSKQWLNWNFIRRALAAAFLPVALAACGLYQIANQMANYPGRALIQAYEGEARPDSEIAVLLHQATCDFTIQLATLNEQPVRPQCVAGGFTGCTVRLLPGTHRVFLREWMEWMGRTEVVAEGRGQAITFVAEAGHTYFTRCAEQTLLSRKRVNLGVMGAPGTWETYSVRFDIVDKGKTAVDMGTTKAGADATVAPSGRRERRAVK